MAPLRTPLIASVLSLVGSVLAHGGVTTIAVNGVKYQGWQPFNPATGQVSAERPYSSFNPIQSATDSTLSCNDNGAQGPSQQYITLAAGSQITSMYTQWTHLPGPYQVYLSACNGDCSSINTNAPIKWFKIDEMGLINGTVYNGNWANGILLNTLQWTTTIPSNLLPGNYFIRWETLAIHQANTPQWYPECAQLTITGSGTAFPPSSYILPIPGAWGANDPGVNIDIYSTAAQTETTYLIPGPRVWPGFAGYTPPANLPPGAYPSGTGPSSPPPSSTPAPPPFKTTTTGPSPPTTTPQPTTTPVSPPTGTVPEYGQCGGEGYTGATGCVSPYVCKVSNPYYSQCLPA